MCVSRAKFQKYHGLHKFCILTIIKLGFSAWQTNTFTTRLPKCRLSRGVMMNKRFVSNCSRPVQEASWLTRLKCLLVLITQYNRVINRAPTLNPLFEHEHNFIVNHSHVFSHICDENKGLNILRTTRSLIVSRFIQTWMRIVCYSKIRLCCFVKWKYTLKHGPVHDMNIKLSRILSKIKYKYKKVTKFVL